jgi:hypothetical protein
MARRTMTPEPTPMTRPPLSTPLRVTVALVAACAALAGTSLLMRAVVDGRTAADADTAPPTGAGPMRAAAGADDLALAAPPHTVPDVGPTDYAPPRGVVDPPAGHAPVRHRDPNGEPAPSAPR